MKLGGQDLTIGELTLASRTIAMLAVDMVEAANSGHPGAPMGLSDVATVLTLGHLRVSPKHLWLGRDRLVLSNGHASALQWALGHLLCFGYTLEDLKNFRQWGSICPGHPERAPERWVECTTGPLAQGLAASVGMALQAKRLNARYGVEVFDGRIWCIVGEGCLEEGLGYEAASFAGHHRLGNLKVIFDRNNITIAGDVKRAWSENVRMRFEACGWLVLEVDGHDFPYIDHGLTEAEKETSRPCLIIADTIIGRGSPNKAGKASSHGAPLGKDEARLAKQALGQSAEQVFHVPERVREIFETAGLRSEALHAEWKTRFEASFRDRAEDEQRLLAELGTEVPADIEALLLSAIPASPKPAATRSMLAELLRSASQAVPSLVAGSADLAPSTGTVIKESGFVMPQDRGARNIDWGVREFAMGAVGNGMACYGGVIPLCSTFFTFLDYMLPAVRMAALSGLHHIFVFTHDSIFVGEDGPTHQPTNHLVMLRTIPNLKVFRPANWQETAVAFAQALSSREGPSAIVLSRQTVGQFEVRPGVSPDDIKRGAYAVFERLQGRSPEVVIAATGSEVSLAVETAKTLSARASVRVVSIPSWDAFRSQGSEYMWELFPEKAVKLCLEAGSTFGWETVVPGVRGENLFVLGVDQFGVSAPAEVLADRFGFTVEGVISLVRSDQP